MQAKTWNKPSLTIQSCVNGYGGGGGGGGGGTRGTVESIADKDNGKRKHMLPNTHCNC